MRLALCVAALAMLVAAASAATTCDNTKAYASPVVDQTDSKIGDTTLLKFYVFATHNDSVGVNLDFLANGASQCAFAHVAESTTTLATQGYWTKTVTTGGASPCDTYVFSASVADAIRNCGWGNGVVAGTISTWDNKLTITTRVATGGSVYGTGIVRTDQQVLKYSISYLTQVNTNGTATALPSALAFSATTTQSVTYGGLTGAPTGTVSFATSVQGPYQIAITGLAGSPDWDVTIGTATTACVAQSTGSGSTGTFPECKQTTVFALARKSGSTACTLAGTITGNIAFSCQTGFTGSCDLPAPPSQPFTITLNSDNFCARLVEVGDLSATMYLSATPTDRYAQPPVVAADYTSSSVVYGSVIFANEATLSIAKVYPQTITIVSNCAGTGCPQNLLIYDVNTPSDSTQAALRLGMSWSGILGGASEGDPVDFIENVNRLNQYIFSFILNEVSVRFDNGEQSGNVNVQVIIKFKIEYDDVTGQKVTRFHTAALTPAGVTAEASAGIGPAGTATSSESTVLGVTQGTVVVVGCTFAALLVAVVAASVVVSRRRAANKAASKAQMSSSQVNLTLRQSPSAAATSAGLVNLSTQNLQTVQSAYDASIQA